tara:strand:+ start:474 stop:1145 length:672 start_codon:yes stop_codon:yes gene_type:complete
MEIPLSGKIRKVVKYSATKALYIGAGNDTMPIAYLKHITDFVFIDCQPFSEFGVKVHKCDPKYCREDCVGYSRPWFVNDVITKMIEMGMNYKKISENELEFTNDSQRVTYFINTSMPDHIDRVKDRIKDFDVFIVIGHNPDSEALKYTTKKISFWGGINTVYTPEDEELTHVITRLCNEKKFISKFHQFNLLLADSFLDSHCYEHQEFNTWENFLEKGSFKWK